MNKKAIIICLCLAVIVTIGTIFFVNHEQFKIVPPENKGILTSVSPAQNSVTASTPTSSISATTSPEDLILNDIAAGKITTSTVKWLSYKNNEYGFSFSYPEKANWGGYNSGVLASSTDDQAFLNYQVYQQNNLFLLRPVGYSSSSEKSQYEAGYNYVTWRIEIKKISGEKELASFIKQEYGQTCKYSLTKVSGSSTTYNVDIIGDGGDMISSQCHASLYSYYLKYSPTRQEIAFWNTGQECQIGLYPIDYPHDNCFDAGIANSFRFTK
jgi:hypothetical protein